MEIKKPTADGVSHVYHVFFEWICRAALFRRMRADARGVIKRELEGLDFAR